MIKRPAKQNLDILFNIQFLRQFDRHNKIKKNIDIHLAKQFDKKFNGNSQ